MSVIGQIEQQLYQIVIEKFNKRVDICEYARDEHMLDIVFLFKCRNFVIKANCLFVLKIKKKSRDLTSSHLSLASTVIP